MLQHSWLYSDSFLKRAFAYLGYYTVAQLLFLAAYIVVVFATSISLGRTLREFDNPTPDSPAAIDLAD